MLLVGKIPGNRLSLDAVNDRFKWFGSVTNVAVDSPTTEVRARVTEHDQA